MIKLKKGDIFQIVFVLIIILVMAILALIVGKLSYEFGEAYKNPALMLNDSQAGSQSNQIIQDAGVPTMDFFIFFFFFGSNVGLIVAAIRTKYTPTLIFLFLMLVLIEILLAAGVVNLYQGFSSLDSLDPVPAKMFLTSLLLSKYFPLMISVIGAVVLIFMYSKTGADANI